MKLFNPLYLVILGPSGSGKDTQADLIAKKFGGKNISTGRLLRKEIKRKTPLGKRIERTVGQGKWVSPNLTMKVLRPVLDKYLKKGFILNGFPREVRQAYLLEKYCRDHGIKIKLAIHLLIRPEVIMERRKRAWAEGKNFYKEGKRIDETENSIKQRFLSYFKTINPILSFYRRKEILVEIDAERPILEIFRDICKVIKNNTAKND